MIMMDLCGVPITFLGKHNPNQFEILGYLKNGSDSEYDFEKPYINGKCMYARLIIRKV